MDGRTGEIDIVIIIYNQRGFPSKHTILLLCVYPDMIDDRSSRSNACMRMMRTHVLPSSMLYTYDLRLCHLFVGLQQ